MTKLCPRGKAAAKRKFKVYPSSYANAYASKICAGKIILRDVFAAPVMVHKPLDPCRCVDLWYKGYTDF